MSCCSFSFLLPILSFSFTLCLSLSLSIVISVITSDLFPFVSSYAHSHCFTIAVKRPVICMFAHPTVHQSFKASSSSPAPMILIPRKNDIRYIDNNPLSHREKYDGSRWRLVCRWHEYSCANLAYSGKLCCKHNALLKNKPPRKRSKKSSLLPRGELQNTCDDLHLNFVLPNCSERRR